MIRGTLYEGAAFQQPSPRSFAGMETVGAIGQMNTPTSEVELAIKALYMASDTLSSTIEQLESRLQRAEVLFPTGPTTNEARNPHPPAQSGLALRLPGRQRAATPLVPP
jgi:hypothetical protein